MTVGAVLSAIFALGAARLFRSYGPGRVAPLLLVLNALGFGAEYAMLPVSPGPVALILYLHVTAVGPVVVSGFWSVVSERFDPHSLRTSMPRIGFGATLGGLSGGLFAERIGTMVDARSTLLGLFVLSVLGALAVRALSGQSAAAAVDTGEPVRTAALRSSYIYWLSAFVCLTALSSSAIDFAFKARAMERFASAEELVQFFGLFYTATSLLALLIQAWITPRLLEREGLDVALAALPISVAAAGLGALLVPGISSQSLLKGVDGSLSNSLYRSAYEPLYTPLSADKKRASKAVIDVVVDKLGDTMGSSLAWVLVLVVPTVAPLSATAAAVAVALLSLLLTVRLHRGYVAELASSLRTGSVRLEDADVRDKTTRLTLSRTQLEIDRERLLSEIQKMRERGQLAISVPPPSETLADAPDRTPAEHDSAASKVQDLLSPDPRRVTRVLGEAPFDVRMVPFAIPLLSRDDIGSETMNALAALGDRVSGQLGDALLDRERSSAKVRRRLARILGKVGGDRAAQALALSLEDPEFDVRRQVARGLLAIRRRGAAVPVERNAILAQAVRVLSAEPRVRVEQRVEHAFTLLGLVQDPEALALAHRALSGADLALRGTALEYLENVLPDDVRAELHRLIVAEPLPISRRGQGELLAELKRTLG